MIQLRILGAPTVEDGNGGKAGLLLSRPKRLALLAYLATTTNGTLARREVILGLFWPEEPDQNARHSLNQALHVLRSMLGADTIVTKGDGIGLDHRLFWCDAAAFQEALKRGDRQTALNLYRGKLLEGFFASECGGFDRWVEEFRTELHERAAGAAAASAEAAAARGDPAAVGWARRACELSPYDEAAARRLMSLLSQNGDRAGALEAYQRLVGHLQVDLELAPAQETRALAETIRTELPSGDPVVLPSTPEAPVPVLIRTSSRRFPRLLVAAAIALSLAGGTWAVSRPRTGSAELAAPTSLVAVLPFEAGGDSVQATRSAREIVELLGARLDGAGRLRTLPAGTVLRLATPAPLDATQRWRLAQRLGAGSYVEGGLTVAGSRLHLRARWLGADRRELAAATAEGEVGRFLDVLDSLAVRLLASSRVQPRDRLARVAAQTSPTLATLKAYLEGEADLAEGRFDAAARAFERAAADSTFALAQYRFGLAALWTSDYPMAASDAGARAVRHAANLPNRERRLLAAFDAWRTGNMYGAEYGPRDLIAADPDDLEAWFAFGESRFHYNPVLGRQSIESRDAFEQVIRLDPNHWMAQWHLALLDALENRLSELDRRVALLEHLGPQTDYRIELAALQTCAHRDLNRLPRLLDSLKSLGEGRVTDIVWRCAIYGRNLDAAESIARLHLVRGGLPYAEVIGRELLATLAMARGRYREAVLQLDSVAPAAPASALVHRTLFSTLPLAPRPESQLLALLREWQLKEPAGDGWWASIEGRLVRNRMQGILSVTLGRFEDAMGAARELDRQAPVSGQPDLAVAEAGAIRGSVLARTTGPHEALRQYESGLLTTWFGLLVSSKVSNGWARFGRAQALAEAGRPDDALRWYAGLSQFSTFDLIYAPLAYFQEGKLLEGRNPTAAAAAYARFLELWERADPEYQPLVREAQQRQSRMTKLN